jgi:signal transduction histidine kinase
VPLTVERAIDNVVRNSVANLQGVTHRKRVIKIRVARTPNHVMVEVNDNGHGMDDHVKSRAADIGFSTTGGMGHGMSIIKAATLEHNGRLEIVSDPGKYCTVRMYFAPGT